MRLCNLPHIQAIVDIQQVYNTRDLEYSCSLCKVDLIGADDIENHLRTHTHQKKYKEKFNLEEFVFEEEMRLSASDSVFAVWKTCQSRASKELARIIGEKGVHLCVCGFRITCYDDMRKHFPIKYYEIHPRIRSWKKSLEKCIRSRADRHRIDYRDCYTILTLFGLPSHIIDMKREQALEVAKAKLLEDSTKLESATDVRGDGEDEDEEENDDEEEEEEEHKAVLRILRWPLVGKQLIPTKHKMNSNMGQYGHASPFTDQWGLDRVNNPPKNPYLGYNYPKGHLYPQIVPGPSNPPFPHAGNQRIGAVHPLPPSSPPSFFTARGFQSSSQQESNHRLQTNHVNRHSVPMRSTSPTPRSHLPPNRRPASLVRYEYNQYGNCEEEIVYDDADQPSNLDRSPYLRRHGSSATRPSLGRPNLRDRSLDRPSQRSDGMPKLQPPNYEMRSFMPPMRRNEAAGDDVEMDNLRARDQRPSLERSLRRGEDSPNLHVFPHSSERASRHQFPSYDMKLFATPRRVEREDGVDIFEYSPRESRRSFERPPAHMDGPPSNYSHHHSEEKRRFQPPNYDMRMFATPNRGEPKDLIDVDPYGANYPPRSVRDERPKFQFPTYDVKGLVTPRRGGQDNGMIHSDMFIPGGPYRPLPPIRNPLGERRSAMTANRQSPPPLPPALPPVRERLTAGSRSDKKRSVPLFFLKKPVFGKRVRVFTTKDKIEMAKQGFRRLRTHRKYCDICERRFTTRIKLAKHLESDPHLKNLNLFKEAIAKIKEDEDDESLMSKDVYNGKTPKIYCGICKETFTNKTRYMEHLKFRRHKVNARIHQVFKVVKNKSPDQLIKLPAEDPLEAFCLYMNSVGSSTDKREETVLLFTL
ncbi:unnamed protein product [Schistosoma turkestanicum]|nr:unnamed protein product [Schistosoma turkestanicum]